MCEPAAVASAASTIAAQNLYAKLQKLSEDIQLQQSIITAQKETVLKSRQKATESQKAGVPTGDTHLVHTHAGTVLQHRAMIVKHYELIQQHKQMVKEQGLHVQNLTSALLNIQQETNVVDELMNTKMAESRTRAIAANPNSTTPPLLSTSPASSSSSTSLIIVDNYHDYKPTTSRDKSTATQIGPKRTQRTRKYTNERLTTRTLPPTTTTIDSEILPIPTDNNNSNTDNDEPTPTEITTTTIITTITSTTPTSSSTSTTISSSISTTTHTPLHPDKHVQPLQPPSPSLEEPTPLSP